MLGFGVIGIGIIIGIMGIEIGIIGIGIN